MRIILHIPFLFNLHLGHVKYILIVSSRMSTALLLNQIKYLTGCDKNVNTAHDL